MRMRVSVCEEAGRQANCYGVLTCSSHGALRSAENMLLSYGPPLAAKSDGICETGSDVLWCLANWVEYSTDMYVSLLVSDSQLHSPCLPCTASTPTDKVHWPTQVMHTALRLRSSAPGQYVVSPIYTGSRHGSTPQRRSGLSPRPAH